MIISYVLPAFHIIRQLLTYILGLQKLVSQQLWSALLTSPYAQTICSCHLPIHPIMIYIWTSYPDRWKPRCIACMYVCMYVHTVCKCGCAYLLLPLMCECTSRMGQNCTRTATGRADGCEQGFADRGWKDGEGRKEAVSWLGWWSCRHRMYVIISSIFMGYAG